MLKIECNFHSCDKPSRARGYCQGHYLQLKKGKSLTPLRIYRPKGSPPVSCKFPGCSNLSHVRGYCLGHNYQVKNGTDLKPLKVTRTKRTNLVEHFWSHVDKTDACWNWTGPTYAGGYGLTSPIPGVSSRLAHRVAYYLITGDVVDGLSLDHMCHNTACCRPEHMRPVTQSLNGQNRDQGTHKPGTSGYRNVYPVDKRYSVRLTINYKNVWFGTYETVEEANEVAIKARRENYPASQW